MKSIHLKSTLIVFAFLFSMHSLGQGGSVTSVVSSSPPATACTNTLLTVSGTHNFAGYTYTGATVVPSGNTLTISLNYSFGIGITVITPFTQSVNIGMVPAANYTVSTNLVVNGSPTSSYSSSLNVVACCGAVSSFTSSATSVCVGDPIVLTNTSTGSIAQGWSDGSGFVYTGVNHSLTPTTTGTVTVTLVVTNGTCTDSVSQTINVLAIPIITSIIPSSTQVCIGDLLTVTAVSTGASTTSYQKWFKDGTQIGFGSTLQSVASGVGLHTIKFSAGNGACSTEDSIVVEFLTPPNIDNFTVPSSICAGEMINCTSLNTGATSAQWFVNGVNVGSGTSYSGGINSTSTIKLVISNGICSDSTEQIVTVNTLPTVNLGPNQVYCGNTLILDAGSGFTSYVWQDASIASTFTVNSAGTYSVSVTDANGCSASDTVLVTSCLGLEELDFANIKVYPNPTIGKTTISLGKEMKEVSIKVVSVLGQVVILEEFTNVNEFEINLKHFDSGVYYLSFGKSQTIVITKE